MNTKTKVLKFETQSIAEQASVEQKDEYEHLIYSEVYAPNRLDSDGAFMDAETIKKMAHNFIASGRAGNIDLFHNNEILEGCSVVESFIARAGDDTFIEGAWVVGIRVLNPIVWQAILDGKINGISVEALTYEDEVEVELQNTGVITGFTTRDADHQHTFEIMYSPEGEILGGRTNTVDGHFHTITVGTTTSFATNEAGITHKHRFSFVENVIVEE